MRSAESPWLHGAANASVYGMSSTRVPLIRFAEWYCVITLVIRLKDGEFSKLVRYKKY